MSETLLDRMKAKLARMEQALGALLAANPRAGHGGTPFITDTSYGRSQMAAFEKYQGRVRLLFRQIDEQKEKISRQENRIAYRNTQTKKSSKFLTSNPIHPGLLRLAEEGILSQWKRNPEFFFIAGLDRVALKTIDGKVMISARFPLTKKEDADRVREVLKMVESEP